MCKDNFTQLPQQRIYAEIPLRSFSQEYKKQLTSQPDAISIGASGGSSAQRGVACSQRGWFGPRKPRKVAKDTKMCLLARSLFVYFVGFREVRAPNPFPHVSDVVAILSGDSSAQRGVACSQRGRFGPRKLRKVVKGTKICLLARRLFAYFVGFCDLRAPTPQAPPIRRTRSAVTSSTVLARPGRSLAPPSVLLA